MEKITRRPPNQGSKCFSRISNPLLCHILGWGRGFLDFDIKSETNENPKSHIFFFWWGEVFLNQVQRHSPFSNKNPHVQGVHLQSYRVHQAEPEGTIISTYSHWFNRYVGRTELLWRSSICTQEFKLTVTVCHTSIEHHYLATFPEIITHSTKCT